MHAIRVPRLLPWCTERMTAMERVFGTTVVDPRLAPGRCASAWAESIGRRAGGGTVLEPRPGKR